MTSSPERIAANKANSQKSCGPKTPEGKEASRANALKHGLTGEGIAMAEKEAAEVADLARRMRAEMRPVTEVGGFLLDQMALFSIRFRRCCVDERVRLSMMNDGEGGLVDLSKEGQLAHRYEQAAIHNYHKALHEFRKVEAEAKANGVVATLPIAATSTPLASFGSPDMADNAPVVNPPPSLDPKPAFTPTRQPNPPKFTPGFIPISASPGPDRPS